MAACRGRREGQAAEAQAEALSGSAAQAAHVSGRDQVRAYDLRAAFRLSGDGAGGARDHGWPGLDKLIWITLAMAGARTLAMTLNRLIDARMDAHNPRTANRALPKKQLSAPVRWWCFVVLSRAACWRSRHGSSTRSASR